MARTGSGLLLGVLTAFASGELPRWTLLPFGVTMIPTFGKGQKFRVRWIAC